MSEQVYFNSANGERIKDVAELRDVEWASYTMPVGWPVQGFWDLVDPSARKVSHSDTQNSKRCFPEMMPKKNH